MLDNWIDFDSGKIRINQIEYHRNGVAGNGFCVIDFTKKEGMGISEMIGVVFEEPGNVAILNRELLPNITFGENSWRGDVFEVPLRKAIKDYEEGKL